MTGSEFVWRMSRPRLELRLVHVGPDVKPETYGHPDYRTMHGVLQSILVLPLCRPLFLVYKWVFPYVVENFRIHYDFAYSGDVAGNIFSQQ